MISRWWSALALWTVAACSEITPIELGICGNGVLEPENLEDCDSVAANGLVCGDQCRFICEHTICPAGWSCGADFICRHATGQLVPAGGAVLPWNPAFLSLNDFDGDGYLDLAAAVTEEISINYGAGAGEFGREYHERVRGLGRTTFGDLDSDGRTDVAVPQTGGVSLLQAQADQTLSPIASAQLDVSAFRVPPNVTARLMPVRLPGELRHELLVIISGEGVRPGAEIFTCITFPKGECLPARSVLFRGRVEDMARPILAEVDPRAGEELVIVTIGERGVRLIGFEERMQDGDPSAVREVATLQLPSGAIAAGPAFTGDFNADSRTDLLVPVTLGGATRAALALGSPEGLGTFLIDPRLDSHFAAGEVILAVGDLDADDQADVVTSEAILLTDGWVISRPLWAVTWSEAVIGDFNRDGLADLAAASEGRTGIDFLLGTGSPLMNPTLIDTFGPPIFLRHGDFDGDLVGDLAIIERGEHNGLSADRISVLFGNLQGPLSAPENMGSLRSIVSTDALYYHHPALDDDLAGDLMVESIGGGVRTLAFLLGASDRRLRSALGLTSDPPPSTPPLPRAVWMGDFDNSGAIDLVAATNLGLWLVPGSGSTEIDPALMKRLSIPDPITKRELGCAEDLGLSCTESTVGVLSGSAAEVIVSVRSERPDCQPYFRREAVTDPPPRMTLISAGDSLICTTVLVESLPASPVRRVFLGDADENGANEAFVVHDDGVVIYWNLQTSGVFERVSQLLLERATDAGLMNADEDPALELAILGAGGVWLADLASDFVLRSGPVILLESGDRLLVADLNADSLADLVVAAGGRVDSFLALPQGGL